MEHINLLWAKVRWYEWEWVLDGTNQNGLLTYKKRRYEVGNARIELPQITGLAHNAGSHACGELEIGSSLTFNRCSTHRSDFLNCPEIVFTVPDEET
jgi:hypothetical protein